MQRKSGDPPEDEEQQPDADPPKEKQSLQDFLDSVPGSWISGATLASGREIKFPKPEKQWKNDIPPKPEEHQPDADPPKEKQSLQDFLDSVPGSWISGATLASGREIKFPKPEKK